MIKVGINGYGTIGKRVAYAASIQDDIHVSGIVKNTPDYMAYLASRSFNIYVPDDDKIKEFEDHGIKVKGTLNDLMESSDIIVDATPEGMGMENIKIYKKKRVKAIFQGGEKSNIGDASFNAYSNYNESFKREYTRVVSCNTTALARTLYPILNDYGIENLNVTLIRRATDPNDNRKGPINAIEPSMSFPSHHADDLKTVLNLNNVYTVALKAPTTLMHVHSIEVLLKDDAKIDDIMESWLKYNRILLIEGKDNFKSTAQIMDMARELRRDRGDLYEIAIWRDSVKVIDKRLYYVQAVHQESDVIPENIDAIRSLSGIDKNESIEKTDKSLRISGGIFYGKE
ncbi:type II glyceraldehyde-3-phosphate dehydrogenase [Picrophilus oshimae]|uniref:Glyceraldehyde-3-phosphate dehydrogenase n=1 Tax=Picrophilus torridus (strain ATCC 700027 / DSM 9790 / JCM 10055 / NBRC 100828 / KAW 2/3) TaxID=1122961 RepID=G3P_PICTO|nr:type II glyceraldehyde-3-phosphate dehydrogenase [Picrophilus oshimae]Q6L125.2 RecName: Full=Glyceraldehyde-3-phosphate dehydrogenase; Short=GAPDH; AltName: Full=NAD(P)-dependent glyceraldehyde-3-phosphate dehydrogenase [Picrophilus oshimae DSM 9789]